MTRDELQKKIDELERAITQLLAEANQAAGMQQVYRQWLSSLPADEEADDDVASSGTTQ